VGTALATARKELGMSSLAGRMTAAILVVAVGLGAAWYMGGCKDKQGTGNNAASVVNKAEHMANMAENMAGNMANKAENMAEDMANKAENMGDKAMNTAENAMNTAEPNAVPKNTADGTK
jgi:uncharacterized protein HemX